MSNEVNKKLNILICAIVDANKNPRPNRMIRFLKDKMNVSFWGNNCNLPGVKFYPLRKNKSFLFKKFASLFKLFHLYTFIEKSAYFTDNIDLDSFDLIICHDLLLLPYLSNTKAKIIFDAREYYPKEYDEQIKWRLTDGYYYEHLCKRYMPNMDKCFTVSKGLKEAYKQYINVETEVLYSLPLPFDLSVNEYTSKQPLKLIYHGIIHSSRNLKDLIDALDFVDGKVTLDLMLMGNDKDIDGLKSLSQHNKAINVIPPVVFEKIIPTLSDYDMGIIFYPDKTFNNKYCMPNKLFEFMQARLGVVVSPLHDLKEFVENNKIGVVTRDFTVQSLAEAINSLDETVVNTFKITADQLSKKYNEKFNEQRIDKAIAELIPTQ